MSVIQKAVLYVGLGLTLVACKKEQFLTEKGKLVPATAEQDVSLPSAIINGVRLHTEAFGNPDSSLVVILHGGPGGDYRDKLVCKSLADSGYRVVFYDQRGSGLSQRLTEHEFSAPGVSILDTLYHELAGVIGYYTTHPGQKVYLVGHSWGGILATAFTARHPSAIRGLVVSEPGGLTWPDIKTYVERSRSMGLWSEALNNAVYFDQFITANRNQHELLDYKFALKAAKNDITGEDNTVPGSFWRKGAVINKALWDVGEKFHPDFSEGINAFSSSVLFLYSDRNTTYKKDWAEKISGAYKYPQLVLVKGTGHSGILGDQHIWKQQTMPHLIKYLQTH